MHKLGEISLTAASIGAERYSLVRRCSTSAAAPEQGPDGLSALSLETFIISCIV
jgi:hypothetical protein